LSVHIGNDISTSPELDERDPNFDGFGAQQGNSTRLWRPWLLGALTGQKGLNCSTGTGYYTTMVSSLVEY
jgi:hypothetical protein